MGKSTTTVTEETLREFGLEDATEVSPFNGGHINDTFLAVSGHGKYMLQHINHYVFKHPEHIMENMEGVTEFLRRKLEHSGGDLSRGTLTLVRTRKGNTYHLDENGNYWRCVIYIENTTAHETAESARMLEEAGRAFGDFQQLLCDYPADTLHEIIEDFHNTPARYRQLEEAVAGNAAGRLQDAQEEIAFARAREKACAELMDLLNAGKIPLRVTHNDTKMSNVLIDDTTGAAVCVIDLDTVMPGLAAFDFGDSIRAGASTAAEDETDLSKVHFNLELFEAYAKGYLGAAGKALTPAELETLPVGAKLMTLEVGMRFLADYLNGDIYFKTAYPRHNLDRARNQFKLVSEMEQKTAEMRKIVEKYA